MGRQDVRQALEAMDADEAVREQLAAGDFSGVTDLDLSSEEQILVSDAAADMPEVSGFASYIKFDGVDGESVHKDHKGEIAFMNLGMSSIKWQTAVKYGFRP